MKEAHSGPREAAESAKPPTTDQEINTGGPAYPQPIHGAENMGHQTPREHGLGGMTLLQHYAGLAMQSIIIAIGIADSTKEIPLKVKSYEYTAKWAFGQAQAMIKVEKELQEASHD